MHTASSGAQNLKETPTSRLPVEEDVLEDQVFQVQMRVLTHDGAPVAKARVYVTATLLGEPGDALLGEVADLRQSDTVESAGWRMGWTTTGIDGVAVVYLGWMRSRTVVVHGPVPSGEVAAAPAAEAPEILVTVVYPDGRRASPVSGAIGRFTPVGGGRVSGVVDLGEHVAAQ